MAGTIRIQTLSENLAPTINTVFPSETNGVPTEVTKKITLETISEFVRDSNPLGTTAKNYNSDGTRGDRSYNSGYMYECVTTGTGGSGRWIRNIVESSSF